MRQNSIELYKIYRKIQILRTNVVSRCKALRYIKLNQALPEEDSSSSSSFVMLKPRGNSNGTIVRSFNRNADVPLENLN